MKASVQCCSQSVALVELHKLGLFSFTQLLMASTPAGLGAAQKVANILQALSTAGCGCWMLTLASVHTASPGLDHACPALLANVMKRSIAAASAMGMLSSCEDLHAAGLF